MDWVWVGLDGWLLRMGPLHRWEWKPISWRTAFPKVGGSLEPRLRIGVLLQLVIAVL